METLLALVLSLLAIFLILLVLVQRGRGGGLTGALGGVGGSSAFGAKAGDVFTRITIGAAAGWIVLCVLAAYWAGHRGDLLGDAGPAGGTVGPGLTAPAAEGGPGDPDSDEPAGTAADLSSAGDVGTAGDTSAPGGALDSATGSPADE